MDHRFIKVDYYDRYAFRDESTNTKLLKINFRSAYIRLDVFLEIGDLETREVYEWKNSDIKSEVKVSHCYLGRFQGLGINGLASDIYLTEESYRKLLDELTLG